jgi:hypothetical protein
MSQTFHVNAQYDSVVQGRIATSAQADSAAMRTISFLGLIFLPGTFISVGCRVPGQRRGLTSSVGDLFDELFRLFAAG